MQVCDKLQASPYVVKRTTGLPSGALASPCYMNTSQQKTGPPSLCMAGIAKGPEGRPNTAAPRGLTHSHNICAAASSSSQPLAVFSSSCYTGRGGRRSHQGRGQNNFSLKCKVFRPVRAWGQLPNTNAFLSSCVSSSLHFWFSQLGLWVNHSMIQTAGQINFQVLLSNNNQKEEGTGDKKKNSPSLLLIQHSE